MAQTAVIVIESDFDNFEVGRIFVADEDGQPALHAMVNGIECFVDSKPTLLAQDLVTCIPIDGMPVSELPIYSDLEINGVRDRYWGIARQPRLAQAVRDFQLRQAAA